jgi:hypothetical protein
MAHRRLVQEWNSLVPAAIRAGWYIGRRTPVNCTVRTYPDWRIGLAEAVRRVEWIRSVTAGISVEQVASSERHEWTFGVELELILPLGLSHSGLAERIRDAEVNCHSEHYNHSGRPHWKIVTDGSLGDYIRGAEIVSPVLNGQAGFDEVQRVCAAALAAGCKVNKKCGLHVHLGARGLSGQFFRNLIRLYRSHEGAIDSCLAPSRRASLNPYCRSLTALSAQTIAAVTGEPSAAHGVAANRYQKINFQSYWRHGTVEFRQHQGTVEGQKVINWIKFCIALADKANCGEEWVDMRGDTLQNLVEAINLDGSVASYLFNRQEAFRNAEARSRRAA